MAANPAHPGGHASLGALLMSLGRVDEARMEFETALALKPSHKAARENLIKLVEERK